MKNKKKILIIINLMVLILFSGCSQIRKTDYFNATEYCIDTGYDGYINDSYYIGYCYKDYKITNIDWIEVQTWYKIKYGEELKEKMLNR